MFTYIKSFSFFSALGFVLLSLAFNPAYAAPEKGSKKCSDGLDNDGDTLVDGDDPDCGGGGVGSQTGSLYIPATSQGSVFEFDSTTGEFKGVVIGPLDGDNVQGLTLGPDRKLYLSVFDSLSNQNGRVLRYNLDGGGGKEFVGVGSGGLVSPIGLRFGPDGQLYVVSSGQLGFDDILRFNGKNGKFVDTLASNLVTPQEIVFGSDGNLYASNGQGDSIYYYDTVTASFLGAFVPSASNGLDAPIGITFGPDGDLYVVSLPTNSVFKFDGTNGQFISVFASLDGLGLSSPTDLVFGPDGNLYVLARIASDGTVARFDGTTGVFIDIFIDGASAGLRTANTGMLFVSEGCARYRDNGFGNRCFSAGKR